MARSASLFVPGTLAICLLSGACSAAATRIAAPQVVVLPQGRLAGLLLPSGVQAWLGIPYAAPPVRERRWQPPQPHDPWPGTWHADRKGPECIQVLRAHNINHYFGEEPTGEDCLYLNVWAPPGTRTGSRLPVIVFIHGGGFTIGSSGMALYDGEQVARDGAVFVNFNYRLGALGFMAHPELSAESAHHASGNYGFLDQIAALTWIHDNIARFGGDPAHVIISGQSAGAGSASLLQLSPLAKGLFRGVVAMSGGAWGGLGDPLPPSLAEAEKIGLQMQEALKARSIEEMRQIPADRILALQQDCQLGCSGSIRIGGANIDGWFLPAPPAELMRSHAGSDVPVIAGFTRDESSNALRTAQSPAEYRAAAEQTYGDNAAEFLQLYPADTVEEVHDQGKIAAREGVIERGARNWAIAQAASNRSPTWLFMLTRVQPFNPAVVIADHPERIGAYHTSDVPYWFQTFDALNLFRPTRNWTPDDRGLGYRMTEALIQFAQTGSPATSQLPWIAWQPDREQLLELDLASHMAPMDTNRLEFQREHPPRGGGLAGPRGPRD
jgi:para-nitrobenzyl esterase